MKIKNATVSKSNAKYRIVNNNYDLVIGENTVVESIDNIANIPMHHFNFKPIKDILQLPEYTYTGK